MCTQMYWTRNASIPVSVWFTNLILGTVLIGKVVFRNLLILNPLFNMFFDIQHLLLRPCELFLPWSACWGDFNGFHFLIFQLMMDHLLDPGKWADVESHPLDAHVTKGYWNHHFKVTLVSQNYDTSVWGLPALVHLARHSHAQALILRQEILQ